jgi:hypothetical protein
MALNTQQFNQLRASLANKQKDMSEQGIDAESQKGYFQRLKDTFVKESLEIGEGVQRGAELMGEGKTKEGVVRSGLAGAGGFVRIMFSPITEALAPVITPLVQKATSGQTAQNVLKNIDTWAKENPDAAANLKNIIDVGTSVIGTKGIKATAPILEKGAVKTGQVALKGAEKAGSGLKGLGVKSYGLSVPAEEATKIMVQTYEAAQPTLMQRIGNFFTGKATKQIGTKPITEAETATRLGFVGTEKQLGVQAKRASDSLWEGIIKPKLQSTKIKVNMKEFLGNIEKEIRKIAELGRRNDMLEAFNAFKEDFKNVGSIGLEKLQQYKEGWAKFIPEKSYKGKPIGTAFKDIQNTAASKARELIYKYGGDDIKQAYIDYGNLKSISEFGIKVQDALRTKGITKQAWEFILDTTITPVATFGGQTLYRIGQGLEFIGKAGAKKLKDIIK